MRPFGINDLRGQKGPSGTTNVREPGGSGRSDDGLADASGVGVDAEGVVEGALLGFGMGGGADVEGASVGPAEGGGDALLAVEDVAQRGPTGVLSVFAQAGADDLDELVGDDGDEQVGRRLAAACGDRWDAGRART